jgi:hypothetical protein
MTKSKWHRMVAGVYEFGDARVEKLNSGELGTWILLTPWACYGYSTLAEAKGAYEAAHDEHELTGIWPPITGTRSGGVEARVTDVVAGVHVRTPAIHRHDLWAGTVLLPIGGGPLIAVDDTPVPLPDLPGEWIGITCRARNGMTWKSWVNTERPVVTVSRGHNANPVGGIDLTVPERDERGNTIVQAPFRCVIT